MEKRIELIPLAEIGHGNARITENSVEINLVGVSGALKAWLIGGEALPIGNIVDGKLYKSVSTKGRIGVLITQSGRQMFIGKFTKEEFTNTEEKVPFATDGFKWKKITEKSFSGLNREIRFILSNRAIYENYKKFGHYWVGDCETSGALALKYDDETDPLEFLDKKEKKNGYVITYIDKKTGKLYLPQRDD